MNKIKLENVHGLKFNPQTGQPELPFTEEYVCENCRHIVGREDKFCWACGESLQDSSLIEHHAFGGQVEHKDFVEAMKMKPAEAVDYIRAIVAATQPTSVTGAESGHD